MSQPDWAVIRKEFPALENWTYLDTAAYGQMPRAAEQAMAAHLHRRVELASSDFLKWFDDMDTVRDSCAKLLSCQAHDIGFIVNASAGLSTLILGLAWQPGDEVLTLEDEFPNQLYLSATLARFGAKLRIVRWDDLYDSVTDRTRLVVVSMINYGTGFHPPLEPLSAFLRERNIMLFVDGSQGVGALRFDISKIQPSALIVDAYKWMLSPNGAGFMYVAPELRKMIAPSVVGWRSDKNWRLVQNLNLGEPEFSDSAERFEGGMLCFPSLYAMGAVIGRMLEIGPASIEARVLELAERLRSELEARGAAVNAKGSPIVMASFPGRDPVEIARRLREQRILISVRHGRLRISVHFYNDDTDLSRLCGALS